MFAEVEVVTAPARITHAEIRAAAFSRPVLPEDFTRSVLLGCRAGCEAMGTSHQITVERIVAPATDVTTRALALAAAVAVIRASEDRTLRLRAEDYGWAAGPGNCSGGVPEYEELVALVRSVLLRQGEGDPGAGNVV